MSDWRIVQESTELVGPITVTDNSVQVTAFEIAVVSEGSRPDETDWTAPQDVNGNKYILIGPNSSLALQKGNYFAWVRYTANPERPVLANVSRITIT